MRLIPLFFLLLFLCSPLCAETKGEKIEILKETLSESGSEGKPYSYWHDFINMLFSLLFILIILGVSIWFLKRMMRSRLRHLNRSTSIKILERRPLSPKASLYLVEILGKGIVISESQNGIQTITEFGPEIHLEKLMTSEEKPRLTFSEMLQKKLKSLQTKK
jgi:flagellar biosynthetic protein FliO